MDLNNIWNSFLEKIKVQISDIAFETWFSETKLINLNNKTATVLVPYHIHKKNLSENYSDIIEEVFTEITGSNFKFNYVIEEEVENNLTEDNQIIGVPNNNDIYESNLDPKYSFENFMIGPSNKFAATSALAVAEQPGKMYNPLFIYGSSGLGKTHLMHSIGNYIIKNSNKKVLYITCDNFVSDFVDICRKNAGSNNMDAIKQFKNKYRDIDVLIIDDIHNLVGATSAQQEFFNTFNELYNNEKQIIISSDRSPDDIKKLEERLKTRFNWGLQVNILPPDFKLRMSILNKKIENNELAGVVPEDVKEYIASNCVGDVRKLEGAITRVFAYATMMNGSDITLELTIDALKDYFVKTIVSKNKMDQVVQIVCDHYNLTNEELLSKKRSNEIAIPRMIAMYICRVYLDENLTKIGIQFGGKNHTTVMHAVDKIKSEILKDDHLNGEIQKMVNEIR
ncbi:MAG: chromosomal replication initiator protein DnaA [Firmicutes bacterium]|nr:chromosomal replication initiator protein DnaA [Bacillota bacterium]